MSQIFARLFAWLAEDVVVKTLSNSRRFQQMAVKIDSTLQSNKKLVDDHIVKTGKGIVEENLTKVKAQTADFRKFGESFAAELKKEMATAKQQLKDSSNNVK